MKSFNFIINQFIRCVSGGSLNLSRYAAMVIMLLTLGIGNAWSTSNYYASLQITKAGTTAAGKVYVAKTNTKPGSEVTSAVKSDATTDSGGSRTFYYWVDVTSPGYYVTLSGAVSGTYNGNTGAKSVNLNASTTADETQAHTATATFSEITINNGTASPATIAAEDNSATATTNTCTVTYSTKGDNTNDFKAPTVGSTTGHGTFTAALGSVTSAGAATVNVTFKGDGTYGGNVAAADRSRTSTAVVTLTSAVGNNKGTCTVTASFPNIIIGDGSFEHMTTINTVPKSATATFPVQWADDELDFSASFGSVTGGGVWTVDEPLRYNATDGTISIDYTFNPNGATGDHSAVLTLAANANAGGASKTLTLTAESEKLAENDASIGETEYKTLAEAITAANEMNTNPTVKILRNIEGLTSTLEIKKPMTIDLNSFTVSGTLTSSVNKLFYLNTDAAVLTINDSRNGGKISATGNNNAILYTVLVDKGSLVLTKGDIEIENTNTGGTAKANAVRIKAGARFAMAGGNLTATTAGSYAYGLFVTTNPSEANMIAVRGGTITATAAQTLGIGVYCQSSSATPAADPNNANVILDGVTVNASTTGTTDAYAVQTDAGVILGINSGTYNATAATTKARALLTKGYTAVVNGTFNATSGATDANAIRVEAGITAVRNGAFFATAQTHAANTVVVASGAKLLTYGGTFHGKLENVAKDKNATGVYVNGTLEAQGGTFIGEAANSGLAAAQTSLAVGVYANTGSNVTLANATLRGLTDNTYVNGSYGLYTSTTNAVNLTNCTLEVSGQYQYGYGIRNNGTPLSVKNSEITVNTQYAYNYGIYQEGNTTTDVENTTITCEANSVRAHAIWVNNGQVNATNCSLTAKTKQATATAEAESNLRAVYVNTGKKVSLNGCTVTAKGNANYSQNGYGLYIDGSADIDNTTVTVSDVKTNAYAIGNTANTTLVAISSGKFSATAASGTIVSTNGTAAAAKQQLYGGYYKQNTNLAKYLPEGYMVETLTTGTEFSAGYKYHVRPETVVNDPVCKIGSTGYATLEEALDFVNKNSGTAYTIYMVKDYTLPAGNYTLPANATLLVPYKSDQTTVKTTVERTNSAYVKPSKYRKLTFANGVRLTALGVIQAGGVQSDLGQGINGQPGSPTGPYGQLQLDEGSEIILEGSSAKLYAWGFVTGKGTIDARKGSSVYEMFQMRDWKGGSCSSAMIDNDKKIMPMNQYYIQNVEATTTYRPGSNLITATAVNLSVVGNVSANDVKVIGTSKAMFLMSDVNASEDTWVRKSYDAVHDKQIYEINTSANIGNFEILLKNWMQDVQVKTENYVLPIPNNMKIHLLSGKMEITQDIELLPGAEIEIDKEATVYLKSGKRLFLYDVDQWKKSYTGWDALYIPVKYSPSWTSGTTCPRNTTLEDAAMNVHGSFHVSGSLYTTNSGANIFSSNEDAGQIVFDVAAASADATVYQVTTTSASAIDPSTTNCHPAYLKNEDETYEHTAGTALGKTWIYTDDKWKCWEADGCFIRDAQNNPYAKPADYVRLTSDEPDANHLYKAYASDRYFIWDASCQWWEIDPSLIAAGEYKAIKADHNGKYNYYEYDSANKYWKIKLVTITWKNGSTTLGTYSNVGYKTIPKYLDASPTKASTATDYYTWLGWTKGTETGEFYAKDAELPVATENTTYYAYFKADKFTFRATFNNYDGSLLETKLVAAGETPIYEGETPVKPATTSKEYTFTGWNPALAAISNAPVTYTAQFSEKTREYTVQWVNYNGTVLKEEKVAYGTPPTAPVDPTRPNDNYYTYTFDAWSPAISAVAGDQTYTATYNYEALVPKYTATFMNGSETVYAPSLKSGEVPVFDGTIPTKTADAQYTYTFDGWSTKDGGALAYAVGAALPALTADVTYYAHFATATNTYKVYWRSEDGKVLYETDNAVTYNDTPSFDGTTPTKDRVGKTGYEFDGWSASIGGDKLAASLPNVTEDKVFYAHFLEGTFYDITFNANGHGSAPTGYEAIGGSKLSAPEAPTETGYTFGGWYKESACTNTWNFATETVTGDVTLYAKWTPTNYNITYDLAGGSVTSANPENYNIETATFALNNPTRTGYDFAGWTGSNGETPQDNVTITTGSTGDKSYTANWKKLVTITFMNYNNESWSECWSKSFREGEDIIYEGEEPKRPSTLQDKFTFKGWVNESITGVDGEVLTSLGTATQDKTFYAHYSREDMLYAIIWQNWNGYKLDSNQRKYSNPIPEYEGNTPTRPTSEDGTMYRFIGWDDQTEAINAGKEVTFTAQYSIVSELVATEENPVTIDNNTKVDVTTVKVSGKLNVSAGTLNTDDLILQATPTSSGEIIGEVVATQKAYFDLSNGAKGFKARTWYAVAVPWQVEVTAYGSANGVYLTNDGVNYTRQVLGSTFDLLWYDGAERALNGPSDACWVYIEDDQLERHTHYTMLPGRAYMIYLTTDAQTIRFERKEGEDLLTTTADVYVHPQTTGNAKDANWNGIANPATYHAYMNAASGKKGQIYVAIEDRYETIDDMSATPLIVGQPVFVQSTENKSVVAYTDNTDFAAHAPRRAQSDENAGGSIEVRIGRDETGYTDRLYISMDANKEDTYVIGEDLAKAGVSNKVAQMWVERYDARLCANTAFAPNGTAVYPLGISVPQAGEYTIYLPNGENESDYVFLTLNGRVIWNLSYAPYVADLAAGTTNVYGLKRVRNNAPATATGTENTEVNEHETVRKYLIDNKVYIMRNGAMYSVTGQKVQ